MYAEVEGDGNPRNGSSTLKLEVAERKSRRVVVRVQQSERFLLDDKEDGVEEFPALELNISIVVNSASRQSRWRWTDVVVDDVKGLESGRPSSDVTDAVEETVIVDNGNNLHHQISSRRP